MRRLLLILWHGAVIALLTILTQLGGLAWVLALCTKRRLSSFLATYVALSLMAVFVAPLFGRVPLPCVSSGPLQVQAGLYCALNRHYVTPELNTVLQDLAQAVDAEYPGSVTQVLDAGFPFLDGMPLLPHLSHHDGRKADLAFYYRDSSGYVPERTRSPIGYFAFEDGPTTCPKSWASLRWDMKWVQPLWPRLHVDHKRTGFALTWLRQDSRVGKVFLEPHLAAELDVQGGKVRFQGCRAARHDDHIHLQL